MPCSVQRWWAVFISSWTLCGTWGPLGHSWLASWLASWWSGLLQSMWMLPLRRTSISNFHPASVSSLAWVSMSCGRLIVIVSLLPFGYLYWVKFIVLFVSCGVGVYRFVLLVVKSYNV